MAKLIEYYNGVEAGEWELGPELIVVGRSQGAGIHLKDPSISRQHCCLRHREGRFVLTDLNSNNGTYLNGKRIIQAILMHNDRFSIGKYEMEFCDRNSMDTPSLSGERRMFLAIDEEDKKSINQKVWEIEITGDGPKRTIEMLKSDMLIGSDPLCDITLEGKKIPGTYALLVKQDDFMRVINVAHNTPLVINGNTAALKESYPDRFVITIGNYNLTVKPSK